MNLYFNDLTVSRNESEDLRLLKSFARVFYAFSKVTGEQRVWAPVWVKEYIKTCSWTKDNLTLWSWINAAFGMKSNDAPYEPPDVVDRYCNSVFTVRLSGGEAKCDQMGLSALMKPNDAHCGLTMGLGLQPEWMSLKYEVREVKADGRVVKSHAVLCVATDDQLSDEDVRDWCQCAYAVDLPKCPLASLEKRVHLREDHGVDVLQPFAQKLVRSCYVESVVNSLAFDSASSRFVERAMANGIVHLRLHWTEQGLGLAVQTTGRTLDATERIARILEREFNR